MPIAELTLHFSGAHRVKAAFAGVDSGELAFANPLTPHDHADIRWYVETYGAQSLADPDDTEAARIANRLPEIGQALFRAVFDTRAAQRVFDRFQDVEKGQRVLTIDAEDAAILSLPWELLHDPQGTYLFRERPHISVRRRISGATSGRRPFAVKPKKALHLLFVVSRPSDVGFIDPRTDPQAVLDAIAEHAPGRVTWEFLRPATLNALEQRLRDETSPPVDILHFDGHGVFRPVSEQEAEQHPERYGKAIHSEIQRQRDSRTRAGEDAPAGTPVGIGFLVFEQPEGYANPSANPGEMHLVSAADLAENLFSAKVGLVVLSACQTASLGPTEGDDTKDPLASVAGRLTTTGIPAILAMTHSVLVATTQALFASFYESLAKGRGLASALDDARVYLANNPGKYQVRRGAAWRMLELQDWFLPALFHGGGDAALLTPKAKADPAPGPKHNLRPPREAGFFGRRRELWEIERWLAVPHAKVDGRPQITRRVSITGFGGQGKTELALEAGRWLTRAGLFRAAVLVDYAGIQGEPVAVAVSNIGAVLDQTLTDAEAATAALAATPTLVILDNLEALAPAALTALLDAAVPWSEAGGSRLLLTTRRPDLDHPAYRPEGTRIHRRIQLAGLGSPDAPEDALDWYAALTRLPPAPATDRTPPTRDQLVDLFAKVAFHPLSIAVLAQELKARGPKDLGERLAAILEHPVAPGAVAEGTPQSLIASLALSLERLDATERAAVRRLGVFEGGAFEDDLLAITGLGEADGQGEREQAQALLAALDAGDPRLLAQIVFQATGQELPEGAEVPPGQIAQLQANPEIQQQIAGLRAQLQARLAAEPAPASPNPWPALRGRLETAGLITPEQIPNVGPPFLRFHPTLALMLWAQLDPDERTQLAEAHRLRYYALAGYLYHADDKGPHEARAIARRELPNLLAAVDRALEAQDADAVDFVDSVNKFLGYFGMAREAAALTERAGRLGGEQGSPTWYLAESNRGQQLLAQGRADAAAAVLAGILDALGEDPSYQRAVTLGRLGRCERARGRPDRAEARYREGIGVTSALEQNDGVRRHRGALHTDLADVLADQGRYAEARHAYQQALEIASRGKDTRQEGVVLSQLGTLALREGDRAEAARRYQEALELFRRLGEPATEAIAQHQLGMAFLEAGQWEPAERHYREAARIREERGDLAGAAGTWNQLAIVNGRMGRLEAAETWYRKAIEGGRQTGDRLSVSRALGNLANLLQPQPGRLDEARRLAEEALAIKQTLDPGAAQIWTTYNILAEIAERQSRPEQAAAYRRQAREAKRAFAGTAHELRQFAPVIAGLVAAVTGRAEAKAAVEQLVAQAKANGGEGAAFAAAVERILAGERDPEALCAELGVRDAMIIETTLQALDDPGVLQALLPDGTG